MELVIICIVLLITLIGGIGYAINKWKKNVEKGLGRSAPEG